MEGTNQMDNDLPALKQVSKVKHAILAKYLGPWSSILGAAHRTLYFVDCFAGPGKYKNGELGSPLIALRAARKFLEKRAENGMLLVFVDKDEHQLSLLRRHIEGEGPLPSNLSVKIISADAENFTREFLSTIPSDVPAFFFIDPYGHPLTIPTINKILERRFAEVFVNMMWYRINRDLDIDRMKSNVSKMFGNDNWRKEVFLRESSYDREEHFKEYFLSRFDCKFRFPFKIHFSPEDSVPGGEKRTKYYLIHLSNHPKAALLMKEVMYRLGDEEGTFEYSARRQRPLFPFSPSIDELRTYLEHNYCGSGKIIAFDKLREDTYFLPFIETHYRKVLKEWEGNKVIINRVDSKQTGLKGRDKIRFL